MPPAATRCVVDMKMVTEFCPVQFTGTINGCPTYFRARGAGWTLDIGEEGGPIPVNGERAQFSVGGEWVSDNPYAAGYIKEEKARKLIHAVALAFTAHQKTL